MTPAEWSAVTARVVVEACAAHADDTALVLADPAVALAIAPCVRRVVFWDNGEAPRQFAGNPFPGNVEARSGAPHEPPLAGVSVVLGNDALSRLDRAHQQRLLAHLGRGLPERALLVLGDAMWSIPPEDIDEPEQYTVNIANTPTTTWIEAQARALGFLPDLHRFGVGRAVLIALRASRG
jgi:hypothetical protein